VSWEDGEYYDASFGINKSRRYHALLRDFYQSMHNWSAGISAFAGSSAFVSFLADAPQITGWLAGVFGLISIFELIFRYEERARAHNDLCRRFTHLAAELEKTPETPEELGRIRAKRIEIEADEADVKRLIEIRASNEEARARGIPESRLVRLGPLQRVFGYMFTFGLRKLEKSKAAMEEAETMQASATPGS
jgi:hypothetical protein